MQSDPVPIVPYRSHQDALQFLATAMERPNRIALMQGPGGAGKTTILQAFVETSLRGSPVAHIDGAYLEPHNLLTGVLEQFNLRIQTQQDDQLMQLLSNFAAQETREKRPPVLIVDDVDRANAGTLRLLNWLAALEAGEEYLVRIILTGRERLADLERNEGLRNIARRRPAIYSLNPLSPYEAMSYLRIRFMAAGGDGADEVFTPDICDRLYELARGWPGPLIAAAQEVPQHGTGQSSTIPAARVVLTRNGETLARHELTERRYVIGRSDLSDIVVEDAFVSKQHAMLQVLADAIVLFDLNSTNGTTVNSRKVQKAILRNDDIIALGTYRLKLENAPAVDREVADSLATSDTVTMKTLADVRRARARETVRGIREDSAG